jgi:hypothetical protein
LVTLSATITIQTGPAVFQTGSAPGIRPAKLSPPATPLIAFRDPLSPLTVSAQLVAAAD